MEPGGISSTRHRDGNPPRQTSATGTKNFSHNDGPPSAQAPLGSGTAGPRVPQERKGKGCCPAAPPRKSLASLRRGALRLRAWGVVSPLVTRPGQDCSRLERGGGGNDGGCFGIPDQAKADLGFHSDRSGYSLDHSATYSPAGQLQLHRQNQEPEPGKGAAWSSSFSATGKLSLRRGSLASSSLAPREARGADSLSRRIKGLSLNEGLRGDPRNLHKGSKGPLEGQVHGKRLDENQSFGKTLIYHQNHNPYVGALWPWGERAECRGNSQGQHWDARGNGLGELFGKRCAQDGFSRQGARIARTHFLPAISQSGSLLSVPVVLPENSPPPSPQRDASSDLRHLILPVPYPKSPRKKKGRPP